MFMPATKTFLYYKTTIDQSLDDICTYFKRKKVTDIVLKFGYSGDSEHIFRYSIDALMVPSIKTNMINIMSDYRIKCGRSFLIIVQPINAIINNRLNEYRCLFVGGQLSPIVAFGFSKSPLNNYQIHIPSNELNPEKIKDHAEIINLAQYGYDTMSEYIGFFPPVLRVDISWVMINNKKRYYINEFEGLSGTYYFNLPYIPKEKGPHLITDKYNCTPDICLDYPLIPQVTLADSLVNYIVTRYSV
jgi:hypothetical protein